VKFAYTIAVLNTEKIKKRGGAVEKVSLSYIRGYDIVHATSTLFMEQK
jgi:hypothetical protein